MLSTPIGLAVALTLGADAAGSGMTIASRSQLQSTAALTSYAASAFTPTANSFLIAFVAVTASTVNGTMSGGGLTWTRQGGIAFGATSQHRHHCFTAEVGGSPASTTPTFDCTGDAGSACLIQVYEVTGLNATEIAEFTTQNDISVDSQPAVTFAAMNSTELVLVAFAAADASAPTGVSAPSNFVNYEELTQETPAVRLGCAYRNTGETGVNVSFTIDGDGTDYWGACGLRLTPA